jgi:hypothetical protein
MNFSPDEKSQPQIRKTICGAEMKQAKLYVLKDSALLKKEAVDAPFVHSFFFRKTTKRLSG